MGKEANGEKGDLSLRSYIHLDSLQPQVSSYIATTSRGFLPVPEEASLFIEIAPGIKINSLMDMALKATSVRPGILVVERAFGLLEVHHKDQGEVQQAGQEILRQLELKETDRMKPRIVSEQILRGIEPDQAALINRTRYGSMVLPGESLFILETEPAGYIAFAANEAEKAARITLNEMRVFGAYGRLWLSGPESEIDSAREAAISALEAI